jgi:hypothetical protein
MTDDDDWHKKVVSEFGHDVAYWKPPQITYEEQYEELCRIDDPNLAAKHARMDILLVLKSKGKLPDREGANEVVYVGNLKMLKWLKEQGVLPTSMGANWARGLAHDHIAKWLDEQKIYPSW